MIKPQTIQNNNNTLNMIAKRVVVFSQPRQNNIQCNANSASTQIDSFMRKAAKMGAISQHKIQQQQL